MNFDASSMTLTIHYDTDLALSGPTETNYQVVLTGISGTFEASEAFTLTIKNPCIDPNFTVIEMPSLSDHVYRINEPEISFTHGLATLLTFPVPHQLCGELAYDALWADNYIDFSSVPLSYDSATQTFKLFEDNPLATREGIHMYIVEVYLAEYPNDLWEEKIGYIEVKKSCLNA